jgi:hypothetical protein
MGVPAAVPSDQTCRTLSAEDDNLITGNNINNGCGCFETNDFALAYAHGAANSARASLREKYRKWPGSPPGALISVV